jgi:hypothetical protein
MMYHPTGRKVTLSIVTAKSIIAKSIISRKFTTGHKKAYKQ